MAKLNKPSSQATPQWTYYVTAAVAVGGLLWGIVSYFIPKPEPAKPPSPAAPAQVITTTVTGQGNNTIGVMNGGTLNTATPSSTGKNGGQP